VPCREVAESGDRDRGNSVNVEVRESFQSRELRIVDAPGTASLGALVNLRGEHLG
jgi:hypothetical protein